MLLLAASSTALAMKSVDCPVQSVGDSVPAVGAEEVPVDVLPAVLISDGCVAGSWQARLLVEEDEVAAVSSDLPFEGGIIELPMGDPLLPDTAYRLEILPEDGVAVSVGFTTGTGTSTGLLGSPLLSDLRVDGLRGSGESTGWAFVTGAESADGMPTLVHLVDDDGADVGFGWSDRVELASFVKLDVPPGANICLTPRQRDLAGSWSEGNRRCAVSDEVVVCATASSGMGWSAWIGAMASASVRRRRRPKP